MRESSPPFKSRSDSDVPKFSVAKPGALLRQTVEAACIHRDEWLVSGDMPKAKTFRLMDDNLYASLDNWEKKIKTAEQSLEEEKIGDRQIRAFGGLFKEAKVDDDEDLQRAVRSSENIDAEEIKKGLAYSLGIARQRRKDLTGRCEAACKKFFELDVKPHSVDRSKFEQDEFPKLDELLELYDGARDWHRDVMLNLAYWDDLDLDKMTEAELRQKREWLDAAEKTSHELLKEFRETGSKGGQLRTDLGIKVDSEDAEQRAKNKAKEDVTAFFVHLSFFYNNSFQWYKRKYMHRLDQALAKKDVSLDEGQKVAPQL